MHHLELDTQVDTPAVAPPIRTKVSATAATDALAEVVLTDEEDKEDTKAETTPEAMQALEARRSVAVVDGAYYFVRRVPTVDGRYTVEFAVGVRCSSVRISVGGCNGGGRSCVDTMGATA